MPNAIEPRGRALDHAKAITAIRNQGYGGALYKSDISEAPAVRSSVLSALAKVPEEFAKALQSNKRDAFDSICPSSKIGLLRIEKIAVELGDDAPSEAPNQQYLIAIWAQQPQLQDAALDLPSPQSATQKIVRGTSHRS